MARSKRQQQYSKLIQKEVSRILQQEHSGNFVGKLVTVTDVEMSPDLALARLYISIFPVSSAIESLEYMNTVKPRIRGSLGRAIGKNVRIIPELAFFNDSTAESASRMDEILGSLEIPKDKSSEKEED